MNPGVFATIITIVMLILVLFGWGHKILQDAKIKPRVAAILLTVYIFGVGWSVQLPDGAHLDVGGVAMVLFLALWALIVSRNGASRFQWVMGLLTIASVETVLMTLVPLDPAFFPLDSTYLYPAVAGIVTVISVRRPFAALSIAVAGLAVAATLDPLIHQRMGLGNVVFGGGELRDMAAYSACIVLVIHRLYHTMVRYVVTVVKSLLGRREGGPEHV